MSRLSRLSRAERAANALLAGIPDREPRVTMAAFDRAMMARTPEAENALFAIASVPYLDDEDDDDDGQPEHVLTSAEWAALEARADAMTDEEIIESAAAAAAVPLPVFELTDSQCMDVAFLLAPYVSEDL